MTVFFRDVRAKCHAELNRVFESKTRRRMELQPEVVESLQVCVLNELPIGLSVDIVSSARQQLPVSVGPKRKVLMAH
jgi:hypothetical protein